MWDSRFAINRGDSDVKVAKIIFLHGMRVSVPMVCPLLTESLRCIQLKLTKVSGQVSLCRIRGPFSIHNGTIVMDIETKLFKTLKRVLSNRLSS